MNIEIQERDGLVRAMGHSVSLEQGGEAELRRRCFETLSRLNTPPDEVQFVRAAPVTRSALFPPPPDPPLAAPRLPPGPPLASPAAPPTDPATPRAKKRLGR